jgi:hypothetical protein
MKSIVGFALLVAVLAQWHRAHDVNSAFSWAERLVHAQERCRVYHFAQSDTVVPNKDSCATSLELKIKTSGLSQSAAQELCRRISSLTRFGKDHVSAESTYYERNLTVSTCGQVDKVWQRHHWNIDSQWQS